MSLTTRCPACKTLFKVVPDQLRISEGWVRCGQCSEIFDASQQLQEAPAPAPLPAVRQPEGEPREAAGARHAPATEAATATAVDAPDPQMFADTVVVPESADAPLAQPDATQAEQATTTAMLAEPPAQHTDRIQAGPPLHDGKEALPSDDPLGVLAPPVAPAEEEQLDSPREDPAQAAAETQVEEPARPEAAPSAPTTTEPGGEEVAEAAADALAVVAAPAHAALEHDAAAPVGGTLPLPPEHMPPEHLLLRADAGPQDAPDAPPAEATAMEQTMRQRFGALRLPSDPVQILADPPTADSEAAPSFMRPQRRSSTRWQGPAVRTVLGTLAGVLLLALALQVLLQQRDRVAAMAPDARPLLATLCAWTGCTLSPLRQIDAIVIDGSSFGRIRDNHYRLTIGIRNTASLALQMPALELSLTNAQAQTLSRRVILPESFNGAPSVLEPGAEWNGALTLRIAQGSAAQDVAGYGLFAFYP